MTLIAWQKVLKEQSQALRVIHMLYADDLSFTTNRTDQMQCMLDRLRGYAARKGLTVNVAKSVVHFNSRAGSQLPTFRCGEDRLANTDSFIYLGMHFTRNGNMVAAAECVVPCWLPTPETICKRAWACRQTTYSVVVDRNEGAEMDCPLQTGLLCFLKRVLGAKRTTYHWTGSNMVLQVSFVLQQYDCEEDAAVLTVIGGLQRSELHERPVQNRSVINIKEFAVDLRTRLCRVWNGLDSVEARGHNHKRTTYHRWFASPMNPVSAGAATYKTPTWIWEDMCSETFLV
eukprot:1160911-Pelagomonas_calceolata.AAC.12